MVKIEDLNAFVQKFRTTLDSVFEIESIEIAPLPPIDGRWLDKESGILENRHGIYCFVLEDGSMAYVGRAYESSLAKRVWDHLGTPNQDRDDIPGRKDVDIYPNTKWAGHEKYGEKIKKGEFSIHSYEVTPSSFSPLLEVAIQVFCETSNSWPVFNKQIG